MELAQFIIGTIAIIAIFIPIAVILYGLWRSGNFHKLYDDDTPTKRVEAINRLADSIEHLASCVDKFTERR